MKTIKLSVLAILLSLGFNVAAQSNVEKSELVKIESFSIKVEVDSAEEVESTFKIEDFVEILNEAQPNEDITFELKCNGKKMTNGTNSSMSYTIHGNTNEKEKFLAGVEKVKSAAIKYYNSKN